MTAQLALQDQLAIRRGDTWGPIAITLPDLTALGAPQPGLEDATVVGRIRRGEVTTVMTVTVIDPAARIVHLALPATITATVQSGVAGWDLQVIVGDWAKTLLEGPALIGVDRA